MASNKYKGRPKVKQSRITVEQIDKIEAGFWVDGVPYDVGQSPTECPPETNWDFLVRRKTVSLKKEQ